AATDRIEDTISYPLLEKTARKILEGEPANLLETVAERIATAILKHREVIRVTVRVSKRPPLPNLNAFIVEITRPADLTQPVPARLIHGRSHARPIREELTLA